MNPTTQRNGDYKMSKVTATVHQLHLSSKQLDANPALRQKYIDSKFNDDFQADMWKHYSVAATVEVDFDINDIDGMLEDIFHVGNHQPSHLSDSYKVVGRHHSVSVGDIITMGQLAYIVANFGFKAVNLPEVKEASSLETIGDLIKKQLAG